MPVLNQPEQLIHIRVDGRSYDLTVAQLGLNAGHSDEQIKQRVARFLELPENRLTDTVLDRHANGNFTLRPEAVFG